MDENMNVFVFDIETVPDTKAGGNIHNLSGLDESEVAKAMLCIRRQEANGSDFLPHYLHRVVAISAVYRSHDRINVWSLGEENADEKELIERFFAGIDRYSPTLISWNGSGFDLPVLHYRSLLHGVCAERYWETGDADTSFRWNNYINRYHYRHLDLMDVLASYQSRAYAPLDKIATMLGFPGKMGMDGSKVWDTFQQGDVKAIRDYCETDVLNTYLVYLRFQIMRGEMSATKYAEEIEYLKNYLTESDKHHFHEFLSVWESNE